VLFLVQNVLVLFETAIFGKKVVLFLVQNFLVLLFETNIFLRKSRYFGTKCFAIVI
jgi:hypothetical protein